MIEKEAFQKYLHTLARRKQEQGMVNLLEYGQRKARKMTDEAIEKKPEATVSVVTIPVSVTVTVAAHGELAQSEDLAHAVMRALRVLTPQAKVGE